MCCAWCSQLLKAASVRLPWDVVCIELVAFVLVKEFCSYECAVLALEVESVLAKDAV